MDILEVLRKEESKLLVVSNKVGEKLSQIRAAINALSTNSNRSFAGRVSKLRGKKLSAEHRKAIKLGIAKRNRTLAAKA